jgi:hypothetical protein
MPKTRTYSKVIDGVAVTQVAHSPADEVRYVYDGWRDITAEVAAAAAITKAAEDAKPAGKTR